MTKIIVHFYIKMKTLSRFITLAKPFWANRQQWKEWLLLIAVIGFSLAIIHVSVRITEWNKTFYDTLAEFNGKIMMGLIWDYLLYIVLIVSFIVCGNWLRKILIFRWREHLTEQFQNQWLRHHNLYRLQQNDEPDNPDQRIAEDIYLLAEKSVDLVKYFIMNLAKLIAFVLILWSMSGIQTFTIHGFEFRIHGYLVWIALVYSLLCTLFMHFIGHKLQNLNVERQHKEADYRATLLRVRDHAEQISLYHGEKQEKQRLNAHFQQIKTNWRELINREFKIEIFSATYLRISQFIPIFATLPMYLARTMSFGDMMQARSAFYNVQDGFGWFMDYYKRLIEWAAVIERLFQFETALNQLEEYQPLKAIRTSQEPYIIVEDLTLITPQGKPLFANFSLNLTACNWVLLEGKSGIGKSSLLRAIAGITTYSQGNIVVGAKSFLFLPQRPYLMKDSLKAILSYPNTILFSENELIQALTQVGLTSLISELNNKKEWQNILSGGEQQRISLARALLNKPQLLILDEATNQLDNTAALSLMQMLKSALPDSLCLAVSHQIEVKTLFNQQIMLQ